jgi:hypothetical protein
VYHVELRQFPHNLCRFNLDDRALRAIVEPWTREPWVELGERKWTPHQAKLTVLEGPHIPLDQLSMGRGWRVAERRSEDVTERVLAAAKQARAAGSASRGQASLARAGRRAATGEHAGKSAAEGAVDGALLADSLGLGILALLGDGPASLSRAWRLAAARFPELAPGESLALAERAVSSLLEGRLVVLLRGASEETQGGRGSGRGEGDAGRADPGTADAGRADPGRDQTVVGEGELDSVLRSLDSWVDSGESSGVRMRRA